MEVFDRHARPIQLTGEPTLTLGRQQRHVVGAGGLEGRCELRHDAFRASGAIRFDQVRHPQPFDPTDRMIHQSLRQPCNPTAHA